MAGRPLKFTKEQVAHALQNGGGIKSAAALLLQCDVGTIGDYIERFPDLLEVIKETKEGLLDLAESVLVSSMRDKNLTAVIFYLKCQGKARGYVERAEVHGKIDALIGNIDPSAIGSYTDAQLEDIKNGRPPRDTSGG